MSSMMNKNYRAPVFAAMVLVAGLAFWARLEWQQVGLRHLEEMRRFSDGIFLNLDVRHAESLRLAPNRQPPHRQRLPPPPRQRLSGFEPELQSMVQASPKIKFLALTRSSEVATSAGENIEPPTVSTPAGDLRVGDIFFIWRPLRGPRQPHRENREIPGHKPPSDGPSAMIGLDATMSPDVMRLHLIAVTQKIGLGGLGLGALIVAWVQGIRRRLVISQLQLEQTRGAHIEELSLAASGLAHETKNPLGIIRGLAQQLEHALNASNEQRERAVHIQEEADRAVGYLGDFISYARVQQPDMETVSVSTIMNKAVSVLESDIEQLGVNITVKAPSTSIWADRQMLLQMLLNLLLNSFDASSRGDLLELHFEQHGRRGHLEVRDHGKGIDAELKSEVFKPYVTGRPDGHGLGLAIVKRMAEQHGWVIKLTSCPGEGTSVILSNIKIIDQREI